MKTCRVLWAFLRREVVTYASYRAKMLMGVASMALSLVTFVFVGKVVAASGTGFADRFGMSYTSFAIVGIFVHSLASSGLHAFRSAVRKEQLQGTLEFLLTTPLPAPVLVLASGFSEVFIKAVLGGLMMLTVVVLAGATLPFTPLAAAATLLYLAIAAGAGLASAGIILVSKEGEPVSWLFGGASGLLGGVFFPPEMLPSWLRAAGRLLPVTHALRLVRTGAVGDGSLVYLLCAAPLSLAMGIAVLMWGIGKARREGTLGHY